MTTFISAQVFASDGKRIGVLDRVIFDNRLHELHEFVVKESKLLSGHLLSAGSALMTDDLIVPVTAIRSAADNRILLNLPGVRRSASAPLLVVFMRPLFCTVTP